MLLFLLKLDLFRFLFFLKKLFFLEVETHDYYYIGKILNFSVDLRVNLRAIFGFYSNCYFLLNKYSSSDTSSRIGLAVLGVTICIVIYLIILILLGKESRFPFIDEAMQYHIGRRRKK